MTMKQIQIDLQEIRYYYSRKDLFEKTGVSVGEKHHRRKGR